MKKFEKYKFIKNKLRQKSIDGYPIDRVMGSYLAREIWSNKYQKIILFLYMIFVSYSFKTNTKILLTNPSKRESHRTLIKNFCIQQNYNKNIVSQVKIKPRSILNLFKFFFIFIRSIEFKNNIKFTDNLLISFLNSYACITVHELESINLYAEKYIAFNSSYFFESFLCFYFKKRGVKTSSLQHGIYYKYKNEIPYETINYENICADELICWSQFTIDQIKDIVPKDVVLLKNNYPYATENEIHKNSLPINKVLVLLPRIKYKKEIEDLINILKKTNKNFLIRPHPSSKRLAKSLIRGYKNFSIDVKNNLSTTLLSGQFDFCISFNTSATFEAVLFRQKVVNYISGNDEFFLESIPKFNSYQSLLDIDPTILDYDFDYYLNPSKKFKLQSKKLIVLSGVNLRSGGTLAIFEDILSYANNFLTDKYRIIAFVHSKEFFLNNKYKKIEFIEFPKSSLSYFIRFYLEFYHFKNISQDLNPYLWISMQDLSANVSSKISAVYCHNATAFYKVSLKEAMHDKVFFIQNMLYKFFYSINIKNNNYVIVQQNWLRDKFHDIFEIEKNKIIVSFPQAKKYFRSRKSRIKDEEFIFFYPSLPRVFKNFELIFEATRILNLQNMQSKFKVIVTIDGSENSYTKELLNKYSDISNIEFIGLIPRDEVKERYKTSDCLIFPSKLETWGLPISESKEFGLPILIADLPYAHETISNYDKSLFFDPYDATDLSDKMIKAINNEYSDHFMSDPKQPFCQDWNELFKILLKE